MKTLIVYAHPEPKSFNGALLQTTREVLEEDGHEIRISDLYAMKFDPVSGRQNFNTVKNPEYFKPQIEEMHASENQGFAKDIQGELEKLEWCDLLMLQFPLWWFGLPAIMKGWVDRVFVMGKVYGGDRFYRNGTFKGKKAICSLTTGGPEPAYVKGGFNGDIQTILKPIHRGMLNFVGFGVLPPHIVYSPVRMQDSERIQSLEAFQKRLKSLPQEEGVFVDEY